MNLFKRLLAAGGAAGLLVGIGGATQAFATTPTPSFTAEIAIACANAGDTQKITVVAPGDAVIRIEVTIGTSTANGGTRTGLTDASHTFIDQWNLGTVSANTTATVRVWALEAGGVAAGNGTFEIHPQATACPTPFASRFTGDVIDTGQYGGTVKKTCAAGVSGTAVFAATINIKVAFDTKLSTTFALPASLPLSLQCNGESKQLPVLPSTSSIVLHESTLPTGAAAAADTTITIGNAAVTATINNAKAVVATPTPTAIVLPATGQPASAPGIPWLGLVLFGLIAIAGAGLVLRRS